MESEIEKKQKHKKVEDPKNGAGMRMGYHSEKVNPEEPGGGGMRMGYHSEKANPPQEEEGVGGGGVSMGYHSEKVNPSKHSKRLHKEPK